jgi:glycosyltransferase involved in cell wall biosynthesis
MRVAIIHPWFPQYRIGFFEKLVARGELEGIEFQIYHGDAPPEWKDRNDSGLSESFTRLPTRFFTFRGRTLNYKSLAPIATQKPLDLIIVEQAVRNLETYQLLIGRAPVAFWGHGKTYTVAIGAGQERVKQWLTRRGRWFFAYTSGGAEAVVAAGFPSNRTTVVQNSIDTSSLQEAIRSVNDEMLDSFNAKCDLKGKTALFIGGLDASKRLPFLMEAAALAHEHDPDFRLLIAGAGSDRVVVEQAADAVPYVTYLGALFGREKAVALRASQVLAMPGRVGLVAVDSFGAGTPIVTTNWNWHAPEFEYLNDGLNAVVTADHVDAYARALIATLQDGPFLAAMRSECLAASARYTVEAMVENFVGGVKRALESKT